MALRQFIFFGQDDKVLFVRTDAEQAGWQVDEYSLTCLFPYDPGRKIQQGMRIGFEDDSGILQPFEIRKVKTYEPDHYQELTCEHIAIADLTDYHTDESELDNVSPEAALNAVLSAQPTNVTGAYRWQTGNVTATGTSSGDVGLGSIWQNIRNIEKNWNCYIIPRVTFNSSGITGRYLDIYPAGGAWHGLRLSIEKNTDEVGVTVDDTNVKTALFGYGGQRNDTQTFDDPKRSKITLDGYTWPDKPAGAVITGGYIEDTAATAAYGRNGKPRFGFYQNGDITDQKILAEKTWEALQATNKPEVTIDCMIRDMYRMGYHDEPIHLHDSALVEIRPTSDVLNLEIVKLFVDLLDPTATRPTIGAYIPNIVYIQRQAAQEANGVSGSLSGRRGGETKTDDEWSEFTSGFDYSNLLIHLHAEQITRSNEILKQAGMSLDADGVIIYANDNVNNIQSKIDVQAGRITQEITDRSSADQTLTSSIQQEADKISLIVQNVGADGTVTAASIITAIDNDTSTVTISANKIDLNGLVTATEFQTALASIDNLVGDLNVVGAVTVGGNLSAGSLSAESFSDYKVDGESIGLGNAIKQISLTGPTNNVYTLTATQLDGDTVQIGTFSRATTLSGAWSSGAFTVTATPQGDTLTTSLTNTGHWGNPSVTAGEDENTYYYATKATIGNSATIYDTGNTTTISGLGRYNAGKTDGIAIGEGNVRITSVDGTDYGDPSYNVNPASITATASNGATYTRSLYLTQGSWNSNNQKAVNIRVGTTSGNLIGRIWINAPSVNVGTPYLNQPAQGKIRAICVVNGHTYYGATHNLSEYS
jgi:phage minor structural protein